MLNQGLTYKKSIVLHNADPLCLIIGITDPWQ